MTARRTIALVLGLALRIWWLGLAWWAVAHGLGAYIADATSAGDLHRVTLGVAVMAVYVVLFNRLVWDPLFTAGARRLRAE